MDQDLVHPYMQSTTSACLLMYHNYTYNKMLAVNWSMWSQCYVHITVHLFYSLLNSGPVLYSKMTHSSGFVAVVTVLLAAFFSPAAASNLKFGVGDGLAIFLFVIVAVIATCALLGWVSRKRSGKWPCLLGHFYLAVCYYMYCIMQCKHNVV